MKKRFLRRVEALLFLIALLGSATLVVAQDDSGVDYTEKSIVRSTSYMIAGSFTNMNLHVDVPSSGLSTLYVRGQDFSSNIHEGGDFQATAMSSQKATYENNSSSYSTNSVNRTGWVAPFYNVLRVRSERVPYTADGGVNYGDHIFDFDVFHQTRTGFQTGLTWETIDGRDSIGVILCYGSGAMNQGLHNYLDADTRGGFYGDLIDGTQAITQNHHVHIGIDDFQFGGSWIHTMDCGVKLTTVVMGGSQHYEWNRSVSFQRSEYQDGIFVPTDDVYDMANYLGSTAGNTLGVMVALSKSFDMGQGWSWAPRADYEFAHSTIYCSGERGGDYRTGHTVAWKPYHMPAKLMTNRNTFRGGATLTYANEAGDVSLTAMYGRVIEKDLGVANIAGSGYENIMANVGNYGQDSLLTGAHIGRYFNSEKTFYISGDYQLTLYKMASNQMASMMIATKF